MGRQQRWNVLPLALLGAALWSIPARAAAPAQAGTVNYVEGRVLMDGKPVTSRDLGNVTAFEGSVVATRRGKAEILLTPGAVLRLGDNSQVRMDSEFLNDTRVTLLSGEALVEADQVFPDNHIAIAQGSAVTTVLKKGLYRFDAATQSASVIDGEAVVTEGGRSVRLKGSHQVLLADARLKPQKFDRAAEDDLYAWSQLRSQYQASASAQEASILAPGGPGWYGAGWYWDPWFSMYAFLPGDGFFYGPFGFPFYSPYYVGAFGYGPGYGRGGHGWRGGWRGQPGRSGAWMGSAPRMGGGGMHGGGGFAGRR